MRKIIFSLLLAGVAVSPAIAGPQDSEQSEQRARPDRSEAREQFRAQRDAQRADNGSRPERPQFDGNRGDRPQFGGQPPSFDAQAGAVARANRADIEQIRAAREAQRGDGTARWNRDNVQRSGETSHWTRQPDQQAGETRRWTRDRSGGWTRPGGEVNQNWQQQSWQQRQPTVRDPRQWSGTTWHRDWRNDRRYDWRRYRDQHRSTFRIGIYYDPFGYDYRRYDIGYRLSPAYYGQRYWFDPAMYGLPYPPPGTQWIRYWNDALLVDIYSGQVIDAIPNFFW